MLDTRTSPDHDVVIVGAGTAGSVLAARLTEAGDRRVLVIEAGPDYRSVAELPASLLDPADMSNSLPASPHNWALHGKLIDGVEVPITRGKTVGGSSSVNGAYFVRGTRADFTAWVAAGNDAWSYEQVLPYYTKLETDRDFDGPLHGTDGPIPVHREGADRAESFTTAFTAACRSIGHPLEPDKNAGGAEGVGPIPMNIENGRRVSAAVGYLFPALSRPNLTLIGRAQATRLVFDGDRCVGVEYVHDGATHTTYAREEVIVCTGALRTPHLLMNSGIGPAAHLRQHQIQVVQDLPGVGANLTDHPELSVRWNHAAKLPAMPGRGVITSALHWTSDTVGRPGDLELLPFVATAGQIMKATSMARRPIQALQAIRKTSLQYLLTQAKAMRLPFIAVGLQDEHSRGTVRLRSANPLDAPLLDWNLMSEPTDRARFREGVRKAAEIFSTREMRAIRASTVNLSTEDLRDDASLDAWARANIFTVGHACGTARMGAASDAAAVVDQYGNVHGLHGLRIVDTSIFPVIPTRGPNATTVMTAERLASVINGDLATQAGTLPQTWGRLPHPPHVRTEHEGRPTL
jgi:choline dehydrogenase